MKHLLLTIALAASLCSAISSTAASASTAVPPDTAPNPGGTDMAADSTAAQGAANDPLVKIFSKMDTAKQQTVRRIFTWGEDLFTFQHLHLWKIDVGPIFNMLHYNRMEGAVPLLSLRSNQHFSEQFTFGGYYGYSFNNHRHTYGGNVKWRFGKEFRHRISINYDHRTYRYGFDDMAIHDENRMYDYEFIGTLWQDLSIYPTFSSQDKIQLGYQYERSGLKFSTAALAYRAFGNSYVPFIRHGQIVGSIDVVAVQANIRLSWDEQTRDAYFQRIYTSSPYPAIHLTTEAGYYSVASEVGIYGKFGIYAHQEIPVGGGDSFSWIAQSNAVAGRVPFPLLIIARTTSRQSIVQPDFRLLNPMEFESDLYTSLNLRYHTRGYLFGYIPYFKELGIREDIIFNISYGSLSDRHRQLLEIPTLTRQWNRTPYIEAGFGFSKILDLVKIEFLWRITHRDNPYATNFAIVWDLDL